MFQRIFTKLVTVSIMKDKDRKGVESMQTPKEVTETGGLNRPIDILNREGIVNQIMDLINSVSESKGSCTFSLNGRWGVGKSYVLNMLEERLLTYQAGARYVVFHYNCWKYDYYEEPLFAIVAAMLEGIDEETHFFSQDARDKAKAAFKLAEPFLKKIASAASKNLIGFDAIRLYGMLKNEKKAFDDVIECERKERVADDPFFHFNQSLLNVRKQMKQLSGDHTIVVVVDELDRCLPTYAIKVLERLHHMFYGIQNCVVVLGVEKDQLTHTIKQVFGEQTDVEHYLRKFIDFEMRLSSGDLQKSFLSEHENYISMFEDSLVDPDFNVEELCVALFGDESVEIRRKEHLIERITTAHRMLFNDKKKDYSFMCAELMWVAFNEIYEEHYTSPVVFVDGMITLKSMQKSAFNIENSGFSDYVKEYWADVEVVQAIEVNEVTGKEEKVVYFEEPINMPQLLTWYLWEMYPINAMEYTLRASLSHKDAFNLNARDLRKFASIMRIIK